MIPEYCHMLKGTIVCSAKKYFYLTTRYHPLICLWLWPHEDLPATSCPFPRVPAHFPQPASHFPHTRASTKQESGRFQLRSLIFVRLRPIIDIYAAIIDDAATRSEGAVIVASIIEVNRWLSICIGWFSVRVTFCISTHRFGQIYYIGIQYSLDGWLYHRSKI